MNKKAKAAYWAMLRAALFLARFGVAGPPEELQAKTWGEAFERFRRKLGGRRAPAQWANRIKNFRDLFDTLVENGRQGWKRPLTADAQNVFAVWSDAPREEFWREVRQYCA